MGILTYFQLLHSISVCHSIVDQCPETSVVEIVDVTWGKDKTRGRGNHLQQKPANGENQAR